ncbi:MAG: hypothetical protein GF418_11610 [Chitinivibrionales bacterium]|nr:hypothetical protein [Chitinivibrionales bacterium]MBD3396262.1 hypothetical protein [Chitinivibrionales bacterium]
MLKRAWDMLCEHAYAVMLAGMAVIIAAGVLLMRARGTGGPAGSYVWPVAIAGLAVYVLGRIGALCKNRRGKTVQKPDAPGDDAPEETR